MFPVLAIGSPSPTQRETDHLELPEQAEEPERAAGVMENPHAFAENSEHQEDLGNHKSRKRKDQKFWEHVEKLDGKRQRCKFCSYKIVAESITRMKNHWVGRPGYDVLPCEKVPPEVKRVATEDVERWECRKVKTCGWCGTASPSQLMLRYHRAGIPRRGVEPCGKISADAREDEIKKLNAANRKRPRSFPNIEGPSHPVPRGPAYHSQPRSCQNMEGPSDPVPSGPAYHSQPSQLYPRNDQALAILSGIRTHPSRMQTQINDNADIEIHNNPSDNFELFCFSDIGTSAVEADLLVLPPINEDPYCQSSPYQNNEMASVAAPSAVVLGVETETGRPNAEGPSHQPDSSSESDGRSYNSVSITDDDGPDIVTSGLPNTNHDASSENKWAILKWLFFTGFPHILLTTGEFYQFHKAISRHVPSHSCIPPPPLPTSSEDVDKDFFRKLKHEINDYVKAVKDSWTSTKCTICISILKFSDVTIFAATARSHVGTIFLKYKEVLAWKETTSDCRDFIYRIIHKVDLDNILHIMCTDFYQWDPPKELQMKIVTDLVYPIARAFKDIYGENMAPPLLFLEYAYFIASTFRCWFGNLHTKSTFQEHVKKRLSILLTMVKKKQQIRSLQTIVNCDFVIGLQFWNSEGAYNDMCETIQHIYHATHEDIDFTFPKYSNVLKQADEKQKVCKLITYIIAGDNILSNSKFWKSMDAYVNLYNHFQKLLQLMKYEGFSFADYFLAYIEAKCIILEEDFCLDDYQYIFKSLGYCLPLDDDLGNIILCYLCPQIRSLEHIVYDINDIESKLLEMMKSDDAIKERLTTELKSYHEKDNAYIEDEAWSITEMMTHSNAWWQKWGDKVPHLQDLAIKILSGSCSCIYINIIIENMYEKMFINYQGQELHDLLYLRLNNHFKNIIT